MALPKYNEFYRLVLTVLQDGQSHSMKEVRDSIAQTLQLTEEDLSETLSNGSSVYAGRVGWAKTYLKKAEMIDSPQRGYSCHYTGWPVAPCQHRTNYQCSSCSEVPRVSRFLPAAEYRQHRFCTTAGQCPG